MSNSSNGKQCPFKGKYMKTLKEKPTELNCSVCERLYSFSRRKTCSNDCYKILNKIFSQKGGLKSSQKRVLRSKNEIKMYDLCKGYFNNVTHNDPIFDNWDADILLHDYKIAISWNGDWHYKEMKFTKQSLLQVQTRDKHRIKMIHKHGWTHYEIKDTYNEPKSPIIALTELIKHIELSRLAICLH